MALAWCAAVAMSAAPAGTWLGSTGIGSGGAGAVIDAATVGLGCGRGVTILGGAGGAGMGGAGGASSDSSMLGSLVVTDGTEALSQCAGVAVISVAANPTVSVNATPSLAYCAWSRLPAIIPAWQRSKRNRCRRS